MIDRVLNELSVVPRDEVEQGLKWAREDGDWKRLRVRFDERYRGHPISNAVEILSSALGVFWLVDGDPKEAILAAVNFGRDCDCRAYVAGGLSAALRGTSTLPREWIEVIENELPTDPYTVSRRSLKETADGLYAAALHTIGERKKRVELVEALL